MDPPFFQIINMFNFKTYIAQGSSRILGLKYMLFNFFRVVLFRTFLYLYRKKVSVR
nr:MAG TPA: hypothetical protein [Caudoviricetes sp.]